MSRNLVFVLIAIQSVPSVFLSRCPENVVSEVFSCLANVTGLIGQSAIAGGDVKQLRGNCWGGGFQRVSACVESLFINCRAKKDRDALNQLVSPTALQSSFSEICLKFDVYANSSDCLNAQNAYIQSCLDKEKQKFETGYMKIQDNIHDILTEFCKFSRGNSQCIDIPFRRSCSPEAADLLNNFMKGLIAPMCNSAKEPLAGRLFSVVIAMILHISYMLGH